MDALEDAASLLGSLVVYASAPVNVVVVKTDRVAIDQLRRMKALELSAASHNHSSKFSHLSCFVERVMESAGKEVRVSESIRGPISANTGNG